MPRALPDLPVIQEETTRSTPGCSDPSNPQWTMVGQNPADEAKLLKSQMERGVLLKSHQKSQTFQMPNGIKMRHRQPGETQPEGFHAENRWLESTGMARLWVQDPAPTAEAQQGPTVEHSQAKKRATASNQDAMPLTPEQLQKMFEQFRQMGQPPSICILEMQDQMTNQAQKEALAAAMPMFQANLQQEAALHSKLQMQYLEMTASGVQPMATIPQLLNQAASLLEKELVIQMGAALAYQLEHGGE